MSVRVSKQPEERPSKQYTLPTLRVANATVTEATVRDVQAAARDSGVQIQVLNANEWPSD
jgi:hypothetical protein